jgi:ribosomal protein S27AE
MSWHDYDADQERPMHELRRLVELAIDYALTRLERLDARENAKPECPACKTNGKMILHGDKWVCHGTHVLSNTQAEGRS